MKLKNLNVLIILLLTALCCQAQQEPFFSYFALNPLQYNPGWMGVESTGYLTLQHRSQWVGYPEGAAPNTQHLTFAIPFKGKISGASLNIVNDSQGPAGLFEVNLGLAANKTFGRGTLSFGIMPGIVNRTINERFITVQPDDPAVPLDGQSEMNINLDAGLVYTADQGYYVGFSVNNILEPKFSFGATGENTMERNYAISAGYEYKVSREVDIVPSVMVRTDLNTYTMDLGAIAYIRNKIWGGITYRLEESANLLLGYNLLKDNALKLGYAFEYVLQNQDVKQATSHELFVRYNLPNILIGGKKPVYTPRFIH